MGTSKLLLGSYYKVVLGFWKRLVKASYNYPDQYWNDAMVCITVYVGIWVNHRNGVCIQFTEFGIVGLAL